MVNKIYLNEDGSLDVERINNLPIEEYMDVMGDLTQEQVEYYLSKTPVTHGPTKAIVVDYTLEEELKRGSVIAKDFLNEMRERLEERRKKQ